MPDDGTRSLGLLQGQAQIVVGRSLRAVGCLQSSELFVLSAIRLWTDRSPHAPCSRVLVRNGFEAAGLSPSTYADFCRVMEIVTTKARKRFVAAETHCDLLPHDEAWLLECFALSQRRRDQALAHWLTACLPVTAAQEAIQTLRVITTAMTGASLHLRMRSEPNRHQCPTATHLWRRALSRWLSHTPAPEHSPLHLSQALPSAHPDPASQRL